MIWLLKISKIRKEIKNRQFSSEFEKDILNLLDLKKPYIEKLRADFDSKRNLDHYIYIKRRFPLFNDHNIKLKKFDDYPNIILSILVAKSIEKKMPFFYKKLRDRALRLNLYLQKGKDDEGKKIYDFMIASGHRGVSERALRAELSDCLKNVSEELSEYENESDAYSKRDIDSVGLITNDAVKCLKDFDGRTFAFLRTICSKVKQGDKVLEVGIGTGILSICAIIFGAKKVVGVELNPITCLLAHTIVTYLEENRVISKRSIDILWGDALKFTTTEYKVLRGTKYDVVISENIYTGMFFELQMRMISHIIKNKLVHSEKKIDDGFLTLVTDDAIIPKGMSSCAELIEINPNIVHTHTEVLSDLKKKAVKIKSLTKDHVYDQIKFYKNMLPEISSVIKFKILKNGSLNAVNIFSTVCMMDGDYLNRNENKFLCNDSVLILNKPISVRKGDIIIVGLAFNEGDDIQNIILEIRKLNVDGTANKQYDARLNISESQHKKNIMHYMKKNK